MKISWKDRLLVAFKCTKKATQRDLIFVLKKSESLTKAFQRIVFGIFWHFSPNKTPKENRLSFFFFPERYRTIPGLFFFFPLMCSFAISRQLLFRAYLNMYERLLNCHVHFRLEHILKILNSRHGPAGKTIHAINACALP